MSGLENFTNVVTALAALSGVAIAGVGLFTWKAQAMWNTDTDLARKILVLMYKHKDVVANVRHPAIFNNETEAAIADLELPKNADEKRHLETSKVYERRWSAISEIRSQIYPHLVEVEAVWGKGARDLFQPIWQLETELRIVIQTYLRACNPRNSAAARQASEDALRQKRDIMYDTLEDDDDVFKRDYAAAMQKIEDFLRPKLGRTK